MLQGFCFGYICECGEVKGIFITDSSGKESQHFMGISATCWQAEHNKGNLINWYNDNCTTFWSEATNRKLLACRRPCTITISTLLLSSKYHILNTLLSALKSYWLERK